MSHEYLAHHGIKGQKWGVRRFQNRNGALTTKGKKRYNETESEEKLHLGLDKNGNINLIRGIYMKKTIMIIRNLQNTQFVSDYLCF